MDTDKGFSPVYIAGTDWYVAMGFVYDYGGSIAKQVSSGGRARSRRRRRSPGSPRTRTSSLASSRASKTTDETQPNPYDVYAQGKVGSMIGPGWFTCCVGKKYKETTGAVRDAGPHGGPADARLPRWLDPRGPCRRGQGARRRLDQGLHEHASMTALARDRQHPEHDEPARQRASTSGRRRGAGSSRRRRTGSTSRTATSSATCSPRSSPEISPSSRRPSRRATTSRRCSTPTS